MYLKVAFSFHFHIFESVHNCQCMWKWHFLSTSTCLSLSTIVSGSEGGIFFPLPSVWVYPQLPVNHLFESVHSCQWIWRWHFFLSIFTCLSLSTVASESEGGFSPPISTCLSLSTVASESEGGIFFSFPSNSLLFLTWCSGPQSLNFLKISLECLCIFLLLLFPFKLWLLTLVAFDSKVSPVW